MKDKFREHIDKELGEYYRENKYLTMVKSCIPGNTIPDKMKSAVACSEIVTLSTHFRALVRIGGGDLIPVNALTFVVAESGGGKDMAVKAARKGFKTIYSKMEKYLQDQAIKKAQKEAEDANSEDVMDFYREPRPLFQGSDPTISGLIAHMNDMQDSSVGGGHCYTGEFATELASGSTMLDLLKLASEVYDTGDLKASSRKSSEAQNKEIKNMNFSALFVTSPDNIIYDQAIKKKFLVEFTSKLARRSFFNFNNEKVQLPEETPAELVAREQRELDATLKAVDELTKATIGIKPKAKYILQLEEGIWDIYNVIKKYNELWSDDIDPELESYRLSVRHLQWKTLKLAGAYCLIDGRTTITKQDFAEALHFCELLVDDIKMFNIEINKEPYELLDDYMMSKYKDHPIEINAHKLSKRGYIANTSGLSTKLRELVDMANTISKGVYSIDGTSVIFEVLTQKDVIGASYKVAKGDKATRARMVADGFNYKELPFERVANLFKNDTAYAPFEFEGGVRGNDKIVGGTKLLILDVDNSDVTDHEVHDMLDDYKHHIARTSDENNAFKFRVALELDSYVDIEPRKWKKFVGSIAESLGIDADLLPQSQIYFGYEGRNVLTNLVGDLLPVKEHLIKANEEVKPKPKLTPSQKTKAMSNAFDTFHYAYNFDSSANTGQSSMLVRAMKHAIDLEATHSQVLDLLDSLQEYWVIPLEEGRYQRTVISQVTRHFEG